MRNNELLECTYVIGIFRPSNFIRLILLLFTSHKCSLLLHGMVNKSFLTVFITRVLRTGQSSTFWLQCACTRAVSGPQTRLVCLGLSHGDDASESRHLVLGTTIFRGNFEEKNSNMIGLILNRLTCRSMR